jgi:MFS family permease
VAGSVVVPMLVIVRMLQGVGVGMLLALVPLYLTEVAPPRTRGFLTGLTTLSFGMGYVICSWASLGCYHFKNQTLAWRLPLALGVIGPILVLAGVWFIPESPRFLIWKGQREQAWTILKRLHHDPRIASEADAEAEFTQIVRQVEADKEDEPTFYKMFTKPTWRRRAILVIFLLFAGQATGVYGIANFLPLILGSLGMTGDMPLILNGKRH